MGKSRSETLFNRIAPIYGLFYDRQKKRFSEVIDRVHNEIDWVSYKRILDVGCGTGALCSVLDQKDVWIIGVDAAFKMLKKAVKRSSNVAFIQANILDKLPFDDKCFDVSIASYVAHGMDRNDRKLMYAEMSRVTGSKVIIYDYNEKRSLLITIVEWLERGDYFHFIKNAEHEMKNCFSEMSECFSEVKVVNVDAQAAWYICTPV